MRNSVLPILASFALLSACGGADDNTRAFDDLPEEERYGGTAVIAYISDIPDINPLTSTETLAAEMQQFVLFLPVLHYDANLQPAPALARSWEVNSDTTELTFHLRNDVFWHDGVKTTAYDLKFSYDMARNPETGFPNTAFWTYYGDAEVVDSFTMKIGLRPHAEFLDPWRTFAPVPQHILGEVAAAEMRTHPFSTREPVGNGPFRFVSHEAGQSWTFEANPDFPEELGGRPYLDRLVFRTIPEASTQLTELFAGRVDFVVAPPPDQADIIEGDPSTRLISYMDRTFIIIGWNQLRPPFDDERVRRALTMGINRAQIVDATLHGHGLLANSTVPPFFWQYDAEAGSDLGYNPEEAARLFAEAGFTKGADGILRKPDGQPFTFTLNTNQGNKVREEIATIAQADLRRLGVDMRIQVLEWGTLLDRVNDPERRDFDAVLIGWRTEFRIDDSDLFHCDKRDEPYQWVNHCDPQIDMYLDTLPVIANRDEAKPLWSEYQRLIAQQQPYTFIYYQDRLHAVHERLRNVISDPRGDWVGIDRWYVVGQE